MNKWTKFYFNQNVSRQHILNFPHYKDTKSEANKLIEVFAYDGNKCYFDLSRIMPLFLLEVFFYVITAFSSLIRHA